MPHTTEPRKLELLAPARNADIAIEAIKHGADAVYIGPPAFGARAAAANTIDDIARAVDFAHKFNARVYVTLNTIIYPDELRDVENMIRQLYRAGVDALIIQDLAITRMDIPPIALHASTQCDIRTPGRARFLEDCGMSQLVIARELTIEETAEICRNVTVPVEAFVHGALCVSYSGRCYASHAACGRSANRGECAQICRQSFDLTDSKGNILIAGKHLLSLRDLNRYADIAALADAGVSSFKIEGRLKDAAYVKNVTAAYRQAIDAVIEANPMLYCRSSSGRSEISFTPQLEKSFNRGFTDYFTTRRRPAQGMASFMSPKWTGTEVATVRSVRGEAIELDLRDDVRLNNGDGLGFYDTGGVFTGFRVNRAEGRRIFSASKVSGLRPGMKLLRNSDKIWDDTLSRDTASRTIDIRVTLRAIPAGIAADATDCDGNTVSVSTTLPTEAAKTPQQENHRRVMSKCGGTDFTLTGFTDLIPNLFIPASTLTQLRRDLLESLATARRSTYRYDYRRPATVASTAVTDNDFSANIANPLAREAYREAGVSPEDAVECAGKVRNGTRVMTTRYCLRRETGRCLLTPRGREWPADLQLRSGKMRLALGFDCEKCEMHVDWLA